MALSIEEIVNKHESVLKKYRGLYAFADLLATYFVLYILFVLFNMRDLFLMFSIFEPYTGAKYSILGFGVVFETLGLIFLAFALSLILTAIRHYRAEKKDAIALLEETHPVLRERLRTAYDNRNTDNIIVRDLIGGVIIDSKPVQSSSFLDRRKLTKDLIVIVFAVTVLAYVVGTGYQTTLSPTDLNGVIDKLPLVSNSNSDLYPV
ncbi:MAG TPA: OadG family protein, partial [Methanosarcina vacuolata]|nr:OadG family protein [Methanosarcina vacuolata]